MSHFRSSELDGDPDFHELEPNREVAPVASGTTRRSVGRRDCPHSTAAIPEAPVPNQVFAISGYLCRLHDVSHGLPIAEALGLGESWIKLKLEFP